ncbi:hypothetical protein J7M23_06840 [Candidatus Sumerlaeota bacterium]|nr:hypothetical protein [Candidatus Sumerlaeota bacterium]
MARRKKKKTGVNRVLVFLSIILLGASIYLFNQVKELQRENKTLKDQVAELQVKLTILKKGTSTHTP